MYVKAVREGGGVEEQVGILSVLPESPELNPCESGVEIGGEALNIAILCGFDVFPEAKSSVWSRWNIAAFTRTSDWCGFSSTPARLSLCALSWPRDRGWGAEFVGSGCGLPKQPAYPATFSGISNLSNPTGAAESRTKNASGSIGYTTRTPAPG